MKSPLFVLTIFLLFSCAVRAQDEAGSFSRVKVITQSGNYKGHLIDISDTSLTMLIQHHKQVWIPVTCIYRIRIGKPFFKTWGWDVLLGAGTGLFLACSYYLKNVDDPTIPSFGVTLLAGTALGTGVGFVYGAVDASLVRVRIPIRRDLFLFQNARRKLSNYVY